MANIQRNDPGSVSLGRAVRQAQAGGYDLKDRIISETL